MEAFLTIIHVIVCLALIGIVLLQQGKGADMGAAFGGSSQTLFGTSGAATFLGKLTAGAAIMFMVTSLGLGLVGRTTTTTDSVVDNVAPPPPAASAPIAPAPAPVEPAAAPAGEKAAE